MANQAAVELGRKGGQAKSDAKTNAARVNAKKPRKKWVTSIAYELKGVDQYKAFGSVLVKGKPPTDDLEGMEWVEQKVMEQGVGLANMESLDFIQLATTSMQV